jgi:hypothetical protein
METRARITPKVIATACREAAGRLDRVGWIQKAGVSDQGECALQAIVTVADRLSRELGLPTRCDDDLPLLAVATKQQLMAFLGSRRIFAWDGGIPTWNDEPGRTYAEVRAALVGTAERLESLAREEEAMEIGPTKPYIFEPAEPADEPAEAPAPEPEREPVPDRELEPA